MGWPLVAEGTYNNAPTLRLRRVWYLDLHESPACVWFIYGSYSKSWARRVRQGWGQPGPRKAVDRRANGIDTRTLRQFLQRLSPPGLQLGCKDPTRLELI